MPLGPPSLKRGLTYELGCCTDKRYEPMSGCNDSTCMSLPETNTCADCMHVVKCVAIYGAKPENTYCQFFPRRFLAMVPGTEG